MLTALETKDEMAARMDSIKNLKVQVGAFLSLNSPHPASVPGVYALFYALCYACCKWVPSCGRLVCCGRGSVMLRLRLRGVRSRAGPLPGQLTGCLHRLEVLGGLGRPDLCRVSLTLWCIPCTTACRPSAASCATTRLSGGGPSAPRTRMLWSAWRWVGCWLLAAVPRGALHCLAVLGLKGWHTRKP